MVLVFQCLIKKETRTFFDHILNNIYTCVYTHSPLELLVEYQIPIIIHALN